MNIGAKIFIYVSICMNQSICLRMYIPRCIHPYWQICTWINMYLWSLHFFTNKFVLICIYEFVCIDMYNNFWYECMRTNTYIWIFMRLTLFIPMKIYIYEYIQIKKGELRRMKMYSRKYMYEYVHMHLYIGTYIHMYHYICTFIWVYIHI